MKKHILCLLLLGVFLVSPFNASAQTTSQTWNQYFNCSATNVDPNQGYGVVNMVGVINLATPNQTLTLSPTDSITLTPPSSVPANTTVEYRVWRAALKSFGASLWNDTYATIPGILKDGPASAFGYRVAQAPYTASFKPLDLNDGLGAGLYFVQKNYDGPLGLTTMNSPYETIYVEPQGKTRPPTGNFSFFNLPTASVTVTPQGSTTKISAATNSSSVYGVEFYMILAPGTSSQRFVHLGMDTSAPYEAVYDPSIPDPTIPGPALASGQMVAAAVVVDSRGMSNCDVKPANSGTSSTYTPATTTTTTPSTTTTPTNTTRQSCAPGDLYDWQTGAACPGTQTTSTTGTFNPTATNVSTINTIGAGFLLPTAAPTYAQAPSFSSLSVSKPAKGVTLSASSTSVALGQSVTLGWNSAGASYCSSVDFYVPRTNSTSGSVTIYPLKTTTYWISCYTDVGVDQASVTINVSGTVGSNPPTNPPPPTTPPPTGGGLGVDIKVNGSDGPMTLSAGQSVVLSWASTNTTGCTLVAPQVSLSSGVSSISSATVYPIAHQFFPTVTTTYTITCNLISSTGATSANTVTDSVTVTPASTTTTQPPTLTAGGPVNLRVAVVPPGGDIRQIPFVDGPVTAKPIVDYVYFNWVSPDSQCSSIQTGLLSSHSAPAGNSVTTNGPFGFGYLAEGTHTVTLTCPSGSDSVTINVGGTNGSNPPTVVMGARGSLGSALGSNKELRLQDGESFINYLTTMTGAVTCAAKNERLGTSFGGDVAAKFADPGPNYNWGNAITPMGPFYPRTTGDDFTITCVSASGAWASDTIKVFGGNSSTLAQLPTPTNFRATTSNICGGRIDLSWNNPGAAITTILSGIGVFRDGSNDASLARDLSPGTNYTYSLTYRQSGFRDSQTVTGSAVASAACSPSHPVSVDLKAGEGPAPITTGMSVATNNVSWKDGSSVVNPPSWFLLRWDSVNAQTCRWSPPFDGSAGWTMNMPVATSSNFNNPHLQFAPGDVHYPSSSGTTYTINCTSPTGATTSDSVTVSSSVNLPPPPSTKFSQGEQVRVVGTNVNTRSTPSTSGVLLGQHQDGDPGNIIDFPISANGYIWWKVDFISGVDGWVAENYLVGGAGTPASIAVTGITDGATVSGTLNINVSLQGDTCSHYQGGATTKCKMDTFAAYFMGPDGGPADLTFNNTPQMSINTSGLRDGWYQFSVVPRMTDLGGSSLGLCADCYNKFVYVKVNNGSSGRWLSTEPWVKLIEPAGGLASFSGSSFTIKAQGGTTSSTQPTILFLTPGQAPNAIPIPNGGTATMNIQKGAQDARVCAYTGVGGFTSNFDCGFIRN